MGMFGGSKDLGNGIFETEKSTLTSIFGMLLDYKNQKIDDSQFWTIHKLLNSSDDLSIKNRKECPKEEEKDHDAEKC